MKGVLIFLSTLHYSPLRYDGVKSSTNMVIVDIKLLSGFTADTSLVCI